MKKKKQLFIFILLLGIFILPFSVWAEDEEPKVLSYETEITNWKPSNHLYINESTSFPSGVDITWKLVCDGDDISLNKESGYVFSEIGYECYNATFVETVDFDGISLSTLGLNTDTTIVPSLFDQEQSDNALLSDLVKEYMFQSLETTYYPVHYYVLNTVDGDGNITGDPYIRDIYFSDEEDQKTTVQYLGQIHLPNYALHYIFQVKGNIANPNGNFTVNHISENAIPNLEIPYSNYEEYTEVANLSLLALNEMDSNYSNVIHASYGFEGIEDPSYTIGIYDNQLGNNFDERLKIAGNTFYLEYTISASLSSDGSDTGLFYNLVPFIILILLVGLFGFVFFYRKKKKKEVVLVDEEIL